MWPLIMPYRTPVQRISKRTLIIVGGIVILFLKTMFRVRIKMKIIDNSLVKVCPAMENVCNEVKCSLVKSKGRSSKMNREVSVRKTPLCGFTIISPKIATNMAITTKSNLRYCINRTPA